MVMMESMYTYMEDYCVCDPRHIYLGTRTSDGDEVNSWPMIVHNVNDEPIGEANNKAEFISLWNSDVTNQAIGTLTGLIGPFSYTLKLKPGATAPLWVIGNPDGAVSPFALVDFDDETLVDFDNEIILTE